MAWRHKHLRNDFVSLYEQEYSVDSAGKLIPDPTGKDLHAVMLMDDFEEIEIPKPPVTPKKAPVVAPKKRGRPAKIKADTAESDTKE